MKTLRSAIRKWLGIDELLAQNQMLNVALGLSNARVATLERLSATEEGGVPKMPLQFLAAYAVLDSRIETLETRTSVVSLGKNVTPLGKVPAAHNPKPAAKAKK